MFKSSVGDELWIMQSKLNFSFSSLINSGESVTITIGKFSLGSLIFLTPQSFQEIEVFQDQFEDNLFLSGHICTQENFFIRIAYFFLYLVRVISDT